MAIAFCLLSSVFAEGEVFKKGGACIEKGKKRSKIDIALCALDFFFSLEDGDVWCPLRDYKHPPCINE